MYTPEAAPEIAGIGACEEGRPPPDGGRSWRGVGVVRAETVTFALLVVVIAFIVLYPAYRLVWRSFHIGATAGITFAPYRDLVTNALTRVAFAHTLVVGVCATVIATVLGIALAWLVTRTNLPAAAAFRLIFALPFYVPSFIGAIAWLQIIGPVGYFNQAYKQLAGTSDPLIRPYGMGGVIFLLVLHHYPLVYLPVVAALDRFQPVLEDAARVAGASSRRVFRDVSLPLLAPAVLAGTFLVFVTCIADFGIAAVIGIPGRYYVLTTRIYQVARYSITGAQGRAVDRLPLGAWRWPVTALATLFALGVLVAPLVAVALSALTRVAGYAPTPGNLTLHNFHIAFVETAATQRAIRNSLLLAALSATIIMILGVAMASFRLRGRVRGSGALEALATLPYAVPGTVLALAFILAFARPIVGLRLYNTLWIILLAYLARFLTFGISTASAALLSVSETLPAAARVSGASWWQAQRDTVFPLIRPALLGGWLFVFVPCLAELTVSALLYSAGHETVGVAVFNLLESGIVSPAAALALVLMLVALGGSLLAQALTRRRT
ncbi:MAG: iron ABC transporter permease [Thermomicrobia bacterium]|nr:iron ABC transporter permease [Thermomicrobia bacterium]